MIPPKTKVLQELVKLELIRGTKAREWHPIKIERLFKMVSKAYLSTQRITLILGRVPKELKVLTNLIKN